MENGFLDPVEEVNHVEVRSQDFQQERFHQPEEGSGEEGDESTCDSSEDLGGCWGTVHVAVEEKHPSDEDQAEPYEDLDALL